LDEKFFVFLTISQTKIIKTHFIPFTDLLPGRFNKNYLPLTQMGYFNKMGHEINFN